ncbi:MAG TPA: ribonuclease HI family protein [Acidimicrobiia bacterium]|nr:ribonuclease HI family protein [Acidimicrobiia bacterium]
MTPDSDQTGGEWVLYSDGASRGNPGRAAIGAALYRTDGDRLELIGRVSEAIGHATNNVAEYRALVEGLKLALDHRPERLTVRADSQLLIRQLEGRYRVKNAVLQPLYLEAKRLLSKMPHRLEHVPREENAVADAFANAALDGI